MNINTSEGANIPSAAPIYNKVGIFKICCAALVLALAVTSGILFGAGFDSNAMYFSSPATTYIFGGITAAVIIAAVILAILSKGQIEPRRCRATTLLQYVAALVLFCLFLQSVMSKKLLLTAFSLIAIAYFLGLSNKRIILNTLLGIGAVIFCGVAITQTYFDYGIPVNSPYKLLCQFGMAVSMLLIVSELRFELGGGRSGLYKLFSCIALTLNLSASVASIVLLAGGAQDIHYCFIPCLSIAIYSSKIFFASPISEASPDISTENSDEKGTDTDENVN